MEQDSVNTKINEVSTTDHQHNINPLWLGVESPDLRTMSKSTAHETLKAIFGRPTFLVMQFRSNQPI